MSEMSDVNDFSDDDEWFFRDVNFWWGNLNF
jgi:hypothetical protein